MESLTDCGYSSMDNGTKVCNFCQGIKSPELKAAVNIVQAQPEKCRTDFDATVSYLGQMVMKKGRTMQSVHIAKTGSQLVRPNVAAFRGKIDCKKYPKAVWNFMTKEQKMQVHKLDEQQGIKPTTQQTSTDARIAALDMEFRINYQPEEGDAKKKEGEAPEEPA